MNIDDIVEEVGLSKYSVCNEDAKRYIRNALVEYRDVISKRILKDEAFSKLVSNAMRFYGDYNKDRKKRRIINKLFDFYRVFVDKAFDIEDIVITSSQISRIEYKNKGMDTSETVEVNCYPSTVNESYVHDVDLLIRDMVGSYSNSSNWRLCVYLPLYYDFNDNEWKTANGWMFVGGSNY